MSCAFGDCGRVDCAVCSLARVKLATSASTLIRGSFDKDRWEELGPEQRERVRLVCGMQKHRMQRRRVNPFDRPHDIEIARMWLRRDEAPTHERRGAARFGEVQKRRLDLAEQTPTRVCEPEAVRELRPARIVEILWTAQVFFCAFCGVFFPRACANTR